MLLTNYKLPHSNLICWTYINLNNNNSSHSSSSLNHPSSIHLHHSSSSRHPSNLSNSRSTSTNKLTSIILNQCSKWIHLHRINNSLNTNNPSSNSTTIHLIWSRVLLPTKYLTYLNSNSTNRHSSSNPILRVPHRSTKMTTSNNQATLTTRNQEALKMWYLTWVTWIKLNLRSNSSSWIRTSLTCNILKHLAMYHLTNSLTLFHNSHSRRHGINLQTPPLLISNFLLLTSPAPTPSTNQDLTQLIMMTWTLVRCHRLTKQLELNAWALTLSIEPFRSRLTSKQCKVQVDQTAYTFQEKTSISSYMIK